ncbi:UDP-glucuronosyl/UDP-glucosyltransferase [Arabidopsis thaliana x Arabidopsis arenosa]|uniref:Glycosyltransferase n=1 Tax=Arabidopsis thaliana x Arabidopsis arenosa TaxID=1240361 RepID=A0A8T2A625_9BRAS|nr:UDP-glucuronosyl/UDP-glucosyltransferase [Arabidopsis thaliana x Arabidopsis arenosa]
MGSSEGQETHVLMVTLAFQGHINPMLKLAKHLSLSSKNLHITLATIEPARDLLSTVEKSRSPVDLVFFSDGLPKDDPRAPETLLKSLNKVGAKNLSKIIEEKRYSCIISSPFTPWVPAVAATHNIPCAILWIQACGAYSVYYRYYMKTNSFPDLEDLNQTVELPALPLLEVRDLPSFMLPTGGSHFNNLMAEFADCLRYVKWVLVNSFYELESEIIDSMADLKPVIPIGPLVSPFLLGADEDETLDGKNLDLCKSDDCCMEWLDKQARSSVVYISFGSMLESLENQVETIAKALKNKGVPFLWVIRPKEKAQNVDVLQDMVKGGQGVVLEWSPQERILSHVAISCFVTHCGWNSTIETVVAGVPVVAYPSWTDQPIDARLLVDVFGIGVRMRNDTVDGELKVEEVERCIEAVTKGPTAADIRRRVAELKHVARSALAPGGSSARNLDLFISDITIA